MKKNVITKFAAAALAILLVFGLAACSSSTPANTNSSESSESQSYSSAESSEASSSEQTDDTYRKIVVGVNPVPHAEILENAVKGVLAEAGWELEVVVFQDYVLPNTSLEAGELDANYFQTLGYMNVQNEENGLHLAAVAGVHIEPMGI